MCAGVNDAVHVQVEVVKLHLVGVGLACVNGDLDTIALFGLGMQWGQGFQLLMHRLMKVCFGFNGSRRKREQ